MEKINIYALLAKDMFIVGLEKVIFVLDAAHEWTEVLTMRDYVLVFKNGVEVGAMNFPDRKKPMLCVKNGERICGYGSFTSEAHARDFMNLLAQLVQAKGETNGGADNG